MKYLLLFFGLVILLNHFGGVDKIVMFLKTNPYIVIPLAAGFLLFMVITAPRRIKMH